MMLTTHRPPGLSRAARPAGQAGDAQVGEQQHGGAGDAGLGLDEGLDALFQELRGKYGP